jgi:stage II sporulation protein AA (anti-sigma F factor antagonist)
LIPKEPDERPLTRGEQVNGHSNGHSLSRIASAGNGVILAVAGEIDLSNAEEFSDGVRALMDGAEGEVVLSLQNCGFIDSTGIRTLIMLARELRTRDQKLVLSGLNGGPRRVLEITGLLDGRVFEIRDAAPDMSAE